MADTATFDGFTPARLAAVTRDRALRERAFADAARHSRRVRFLRRAIPLAIFAAVGLAIFGRFLNPFNVLIPEVSVASVAVQNNKLTMEQPKLSGFKKDNKAYEVVAESASQDIRKPNIVELTAPVARIEMQKGSWARLSAIAGIYDSTAEKLVVTDKVSIKTDSGLDMRMRKADVDFKSGAMFSNEPVELDLPDGWVKSDTMRVVDNGKTILFEGRVRSEIRGDRVEAATQGEAATENKESPAP